MIWPAQADAAAFYGNPDTNGDGVPDRAWEDANLTRLTPPWQMVLAWDTSAKVAAIRVHKKCAPSLATVLQAIFDVYGRQQQQIEARNLHLYGGCYNFRLKRGGHTLSMHSYGCAIDLDPEHNQFGAAQGSMPLEVIKAFHDEGWVYGGTWAKPDWMHFQAAII